MDEAVPPGKDDRLLQYTIYTERDGVSRKEGSVREKDNTNHGHSAVVYTRFEAVSGAGKVCEFHV